MFFNPALDLKRSPYPVRNNLYSFACEEVLKRFRSFYESFARVMGAQIVISMINTTFTAIYVLIVGLPYAALVIVLTFFCGMLPIIGNLISNSVIVALSIMSSPKMAIASLIFTPDQQLITKDSQGTVKILDLIGLNMHEQKELKEEKEPVITE